jgi:hydroxypyruvate isomerase
MNRRDFLETSLLASAAFAVPGAALGAEPQKEAEPFKLRYAPELGQFKHHAGEDPIEQIRFMHEQGFRAFFDNGLMGKAPDLQEKIAQAAAQYGMLLGPFVAEAQFNQRTFVMPAKSVKNQLTSKMKQAVETAKRTGARWALVVPGQYDQSLEWDYQTANVVENLKYCAEICEPAGLTMVLEPLNPWNHPGLFLTKIAQAFQICNAVGSPACMIINDLYHQQITEGNLIHNIDAAFSRIAAFHIGDVPGRMEPTTGEINYQNIFKHLYQKNYDGVLCMEHGTSKPGKEGELARIRAYRICDSFDVQS